MSGPDDRQDAPDVDPLEERLRRLLRVISGGVILALIVVLALADTFGRNAGFKASEILFTALIGALLLVLGVEGAAAFARMVKR